MESFMESLLKRKFDLADEIITIEQVLKHSTYYHSSLFDIINNEYTSWEHRSNYISLSQMFNKRGLNEIIENAHKRLADINCFIYFAECVYNIVNIVRDTELTPFARDNKTTIIENIKNVLNQINFEMHYFKSERYFKIIEKDWKITESAEIIRDEYDLGEKIYMYRHYSMKGKLFDKADILCRLYKVFESGKEQVLNANNYKSLASDIGFLSDKLDVRHAPNKQEKILLAGLTPEEQENWYDDLFVMYLDMLILCNHIEKRKDVKELIKKLSNINI